MLDAQASAGRSRPMLDQSCAITASGARGGKYWVTGLGRALSPKEMLELQARAIL